MHNLAERLVAVYGDICELDVDSIVNPAHADLLGGGGLDGTIHTCAGPALLRACHGLTGCDGGDAKTTPGFRLRAKWVIHTVGPIWRGGSSNEAGLLASCYRRCLEEAVSAGAASVAFPAIATGLHGFPIEQAAEIAVREVSGFLRSSPQPHQVTFACFDNATIRAYERALGRNCP
jgi:O-acetyl-ADP-ribose deacetylase (regulator of RNase III)